MAWENHNPNHVPYRLRKETLARDGHNCRACGTTHGPFDVDHIRNLKAGGTNEPSNLQVLCSQCHKIKTQREALEAKQLKNKKLHRKLRPSFGLC